MAGFRFSSRTTWWLVRIVAAVLVFAAARLACYYFTLWLLARP